jgi:hypothetical protein
MSFANKGQLKIKASLYLVKNDTKTTHGVGEGNSSILRHEMQAPSALCLGSEPEHPLNRKLGGSRRDVAAVAKRNILAFARYRTPILV